MKSMSKRENLLRQVDVLVARHVFKWQWRVLDLAWNTRKDAFLAPPLDVSAFEAHQWDADGIPIFLPRWSQDRKVLSSVLRTLEEKHPAIKQRFDSNLARLAALDGYLAVPELDDFPAEVLIVSVLEAMGCELPEDVRRGFNILGSESQV